MPERRKIVRDQTGAEVEGVVVDVVESTERFSDIRLEDGTLVRIRPVIVEVIRIEGKWDNEGKPLYVIRSANVMTVDDVDESLQKKSPVT